LEEVPFRPDNDVRGSILEIRSAADLADLLAGHLAQ
jgi:hypothetical protein